MKSRKTDNPPKIHPFIEGYYKWKSAKLCCSKCGHSFGYELFGDKIYTSTCGYDSDNPKLAEEINRKISDHYLECHRGFN